MKRLLIFLACILLLAACARPPRDFKREIATTLQPSQLRYSFSITPENLKDQSQCQNKEASVYLFNAESENEDVLFMVPRWCHYGDNAGRAGNGCLLNPREFTGQIIEYLKESYRQCRVEATDEATKAVHLSFQRFNSYVNDYNGSVVMRVDVYIPELNKTFTISTTQASFELHNAVAYAIHDISWQIINDPTVQDYILCR